MNVWTIAGLGLVAIIVAGALAVVRRGRNIHISIDIDDHHDDDDASP